MSTVGYTSCTPYFIWEQRDAAPISGISKSILFETAEKLQKKCSKKWCSDFWDVPKVATTF